MSNSKWNRVRGSFRRAHQDLFEPNYRATFYSHSSGTIERGEVTGRTRDVIGAFDVEIVPPATDTTIDREGTNLSFSTSIRLPLEFDSLTVYNGESITIDSGTTEYFETVTVEENATLTVDGTVVTSQLTVSGTLNNSNNVIVLTGSFYDVLDAPGDNVSKPTEIEITDNIDNSTETYQLHAYSEERGSGFAMLRLEEL